MVKEEKEKDKIQEISKKIIDLLEKETNEPEIAMGTLTLCLSQLTHILYPKESGEVVFLAVIEALMAYRRIFIQKLGSK